jgi:hypothetical protein
VQACISNNTPFFDGDDYHAGPVAVRDKSVLALIDTGATTSGIDAEICNGLALRQQNLKQVLFANTVRAELRPSFTGALEFALDTRASDARRAWPDLVEFLSFDLSGRSFKAVIGMDILGRGILTVTRGAAVEFLFCRP